jgi:hypothetical protein
MAVSSSQKLILAFVTLILGAILIATAAGLANDVTQKVSVRESQVVTMVPGGGGINETINYTVANPPVGWQVQDCPLAGYSLTNKSGTTFTEATDWAFTTTTGVWRMLNTSANLADLGLADGANLTYVTYTYCPVDYVNSSFGRSGISIMIGLFAIAILLVSVGLFYSIAKENGIIGMGGV